MVFESIGISKREIRIGIIKIVAPTLPLPLRISARRVVRWASDAFWRPPFALDRDPSSATHFSHSVFEYRSPLLKKWEGADQRRQEGKRINIALAAPFFDGVMIRPGHIFSFYQLLGRPSVRRGFRLGYEVTRHGLGEGVGGGLCQLASSLLWVMLHAGFDVVERHHHDFDLFPDADRRVPFGTGASVFYNYHDLRLQNSTNQTALLSVKVLENTLFVGLWSETPWPHTFTIEEKSHRFDKLSSEAIYRSNEIYRVQKNVENPSSTLLWKNRSRVLYPIALSPQT